MNEGVSPLEAFMGEVLIVANLATHNGLIPMYAKIMLGHCGVSRAKGMLHRDSG